MDDGIAIALGRLEKATDTVSEKVDKVSDKMGELGMTVAEQGVRISHVETGLKDIKLEMASDDSRKFSVREKVGVALLTLAGSGAVTWLIDIIKT